MDLYSTFMSDIPQEMNPRVLEFIQKHVTSFTRWDTIRFLGENPTTRDTAENLAKKYAYKYSSTRRPLVTGSG